MEDIMNPTDTPTPAGRRVLITGANGYVGRLVTEALAKNDAGVEAVIATDIRPTPSHRYVAGVDHRVLDIRSDQLATTLADQRIDTVVHLAAVVTPPPGDTRQLQYDVDVNGTRNVLQACVDAGVTRFVYTSSGAAYGYHADNSPLLDENDPLRGNEVFAYSHHKRLVEQMLADFRASHPELEQVIFRVSTVLGPSVANQITAMFERPVVIGIAGVDTPFCFIWDRDVVGCVQAAVRGGKPGIYNLTGDGVMTLREVASGMGRRYIPVPEAVLRRSLDVLSRHNLTSYGPEQVMFLKHRPVMNNARLKREFGYRPRKSSREVFAAYRSSRV